MAEIHKNPNIIAENIVCLSTSIFILSLFLSFTIDLYSLNPLTPIAIMLGMNIIFCNTSVINMNDIPFPIPIIDIIVDIVYPKQNPLYNIIPNTIGIPITVVPKNHSVIANIMFSIIVVFRTFMFSRFSVFFSFSMKLFRYDVISVFCASCVLFMNITPRNIPIMNISVITIYSLLLFVIC